VTERKKELRLLHDHLEDEHPFALTSQAVYGNLERLREWHDRTHGEKEEKR